MSKLPKKRRKLNNHNNDIIIDTIKSVPMDDEIIIKMESPDYDCEMVSLPQTKTIVYDQNSIDEASIDTEFGLVSQLDIIKSEIDVDETTLREFRENILSNKINLSKVERTSNQMPMKQPIVLLHRLDESVISATNENNSIDLNPVPPLKKLNQIIKCPHCNFQTTTRNRSYLMKDHMYIHTGETPYSCQFCPRKFRLGSTLRHHVLSRHPDKRIYKCKLCGINMYNVDVFDAHKLKCVKVRTFECHLCKFKLKNLYMNQIKRHMRLYHTGEKAIKCSYCPKRFVSGHGLDRHLQYDHKNIMKLSCTFCNRRFKEDEKFNKHIEFCRTRRRYECHLCGYKYAKLLFGGLKEHMRKHTGAKPFKCCYCSKYFPRKEALNQHLQRHRELYDFKCKQCHRKFFHAKDLEYHEQNCRRRRYECHMCGFSQFGISFGSFRKHVLANHYFTPKKIFQCNRCSRKFQTKRSMEVHMKLHDKKGFVKCSYCNKKFIDVRYAKKHEFQCKRVYECYLCKKTFPSFTELYGRHFKSHLGEKPYVCKHCGKTIGSVRCYKLHVINLHLKSYGFKCNVCHGSIHERKHFRIHQKSCMKPIRQSTDVIYFTCSLCGIGLKRLPELRRHIEFNECKKHPQLKGK